MELTKNKITKFEQIKNSSIWKGVYIGLVAIISVGYFIFSYFYVQEARFIEVGGREFEVKEGYVLFLVFWLVGGYLFLLLPLVSNFFDKEKIFYQKTLFLAFWMSISLLPFALYFK